MTRSGLLRLLLLLAIAGGLAWGLLLGEEPLSQEPVTAPYLPESVRAERRGDAVRLVESRLDVMGTRFVVEVAAPDEPTARRAMTRAWSDVRALEQSLSTWIDDSVLSRVNREAAVRPVEVDEATLRCLRSAKRWWEASGGAFDPTVGPLVALWRPLSRLEVAPSGAEIAAARALVGYDRVRLDERDRTVTFATPGMSLDVGGIGKGFAADLAVQGAREAGAVACRVNAGGDQTALGAPPWAPEGFPVTVRDPSGGQDDALPGLSLRLWDRAAATSGNYERFTEIDGERFSHIVDPRTGRPVPDAVAQVTVLAATGTDADALATALVVLGPAEGLALVEGLPEVEAMFLVRDGDRFAALASAGFPGRRR